MPESAPAKPTQAADPQNSLLFALASLAAVVLSLVGGGVPLLILDVPADLLAAHLLCSLPLAVAATVCMQRVPRAAVFVAGAGVGLLPVLLAQLPGHGPAGISLADVAIHSLVAMAIVSLPVGVLIQLRGRRPMTVPPAAAVLLCLLVMVVPSTLYTVTVVQRLEEKLDDLLGHSRVAKATEVAGRLQRIAPEATWQDRPVSELTTELTQQRERLAEALEHADPPRSLGEVGQYVNVCLQLDRRDRARELLRPLATAGQPLPLALDTLGLISQREEKWDESLRWYSKALEAWSAQPDRRNGAGRASALKGMALAQYQTGQLREAAASYESLVELQPTAANHLLAARFYKENDQTSRARQHAEAARELDPVASGPVAERLIRSLEQSRFGCFAGQ
ncbi:Tetratricopeptide repeat protein [Maioricimonas rarisocia]|uniref:Tetratricopeptide repeat protein n=1 Tax=Maioricimonas rarisocia TaxID=2528026 RepID=A0A517ZD12_9PLAN|nr:tetratricopeptide repeat protein [Maioricimonas rarisocia]QDU40330.1 Tetratricopeptide repeat protein [Maioricimonas rarisocia]